MDMDNVMGHMYSPAALRMFEQAVCIFLRLPGLYLFEVYWLSHLYTEDMASVWAKYFISDERVSGVLETINMLQFVRNRDVDQTAAVILRYSVLLLVAMFLVLPMKRLLSIYQHAASFCLIGIGHYMSSTYVQLEHSTGGTLQLDEFVKLERHGFHFLAQVMLALCVSCLLGINNELRRACLAVYAAPIVARMAGVQTDQLSAVHNLACCLYMVLICLYLLSLSPKLAIYFKHWYIQLKSIILVRGVVGGAVSLWRRLSLPSLLCAFWLALYCIQMYAKSEQIQSRSKLDIPLIMLSAMAEVTGTPLSVLSLAVTVSYASFFVLKVASQFLLGAEAAQAAANESHHRMRHSGYAEGLTMILLAAQTSLINLSLGQRTILLGLVMFIVLSALAQSLFDLLEPHLLVLGASIITPLNMHVRAVVLAAVLIIAPIVMIFGILKLLPLDIWLLIILTNCALTTIQTISSLLVYALFYYDAHARNEPWERLDDLVYNCRAVTRAVEFILALAVIAYGAYQSIFGQWSLLSALVLAGHSYFNVWRRLQSGWTDFQQRRKATQSIRLLARASRQQLQQHHDVCAICFTTMSSARVTPCGHFFHGLCLRKWLFVRLACPLCHVTIEIEPRQGRHRPTGPNDEEGYSSEDEPDVALLPSNQADSDENDDDDDLFVDAGINDYIDQFQSSA